MQDEKKAIEKATAEAFLRLYNQKMNTSYRIVEHGDSPDIRCEDTPSNKVNLEIVLTEAWPGDIAAHLGRANHRTLEALKTHLRELDAGKGSVFDRVSVLSGNLMAMVIDRIREKLKKDYGPNTALVVRDTCPADPDWDLVVDEIRHHIDLSHNPYDKGIWIISHAKGRIFRIL
ncbi:MAG: hypothetical protein JSW23_00270 [Planctomycetota bacterium]|nr:MAG: hypothetical protein JSW23_00270 [Planctomycetota bacterium]